MGLMVNIYASSLMALRKIERLNTQEHRAIIVLDNVLEAIAAESAISDDQIRDLMAAEFEAAQLPLKSELSIRAQRTGEKMELAILRRDGRPLIKVHVQ